MSKRQRLMDQARAYGAKDKDIDGNRYKWEMVAVAIALRQYVRVGYYLACIKTADASHFFQVLQDDFGKSKW